jgi:hypothetical protein
MNRDLPNEGTNLHYLRLDADDQGSSLPPE